MKNMNRNNITEEEKIDLRKEVLKPVADTVGQLSYYLKEIKRFNRTGFEGWLKVIAVFVLGSKVKKVRNQKADLVLTDGTEIELKAATNGPGKWIGTEGAIKHNCPCLFLCNGDIRPICMDERLTLIDFKKLSDGWVIGIVEPKKTDK